MFEKTIGLIAGAGNLPYIIVNACKKNNIKLCIVSFEEEVNSQLGDLTDIEHKITKIGHVGQIIDFFTKNKVTDIVFAGAIKRPSFNNLNVDFMGAKLLAQLFKHKVLGDDALLKVVANFFEKKGFRVVSPLSIINSGITVQEGILVEPYLNKINMDDIKLGLKVISTIGALDIGQSVIIENGRVIGIEAAEGTDNLIKRCKHLLVENKKSVLVKAQKPAQDLRLDLPTIGPVTVDNAYENGLAGIAIEADRVFVIDYEKVVEKARTLGIFLISVK